MSFEIRSSGSLVRMALDKIGIKTVKRIGFKTVAFLFLGMSQPPSSEYFATVRLRKAKNIQSRDEKLDDRAQAIAHRRLDR
jgi:hypothetical protein